MSRLYSKAFYRRGHADSLLNFEFVSCSWYERRLVWPLSLGSDASQMPPLPILPVQDRRMLRVPIIPYHNGPLLPLDSCLKIGTHGNMIV